MRLLAFLCLWLMVSPARADCVVLVHGVVRSPASMSIMARVLEGAGYQVVNDGYPSTDAPLDALTEYFDAALARCGGASPPDVVTHSMGAIVVRVWLARHPDSPLGRVVMLAPPNAGSALIDAWRDVPGFAEVMGPAGMQLGTGPGGPAGLGPIRVETGVIAASLSFSPVGSALLDGPDDGKVAVASTALAGMADHLVVRATHTFVMNNPEVLAQTVGFLRSGRFRHDLTRSEALAEVTGYLLD